MDRDPLQQGPEGLPVLVVKPGQHLVLGLAEPLAEPVEKCQAARGGRDPPGPAVGRVLSTADPNKGAGAAGRQAQVVAGNIRALITGDGELARYEPTPPTIIVPVGPDGGAGQRHDSEDLVPAEVVAQLKGRDMMVDRFAELLGVKAADPS